MRFFVLFLFLSLLAPVVTYAAGGDDVLKQCEQDQTSQAEITECNMDGISVARNEMNAVVDEIRKRIANRPEKLEAFEKAQDAWEKHQETQIDFLFIDHTGSAAPACANNTMITLIHQRTEQLKQWIEDSETEGNICGPYIFYDPDPSPPKKIWNLNQ